MDRVARKLARQIGQRVRQRRLADGLSEEAVAHALQCNLERLQAAELGLAHFTADQIYYLCPILRVTPSWFFEDLV